MSEPDFEKLAKDAERYAAAAQVYMLAAKLSKLYSDWDRPDSVRALEYEAESVLKELARR